MPITIIIQFILQIISIIAITVYATIAYFAHKDLLEQNELLKNNMNLLIEQNRIFKAMPIFKKQESESKK